MQMKNLMTLVTRARWKVEQYIFGNELKLKRLRRQWRDVVNNMAARPCRGSHSIMRIIIVPADPWTLTGSLGDQAMIDATLVSIGKNFSNYSIHIMTASPEASEYATKRGWIAHEIWGQPDYVSAVHRLIVEQEIDAFLAIGADIMDGYYSPLTTLRLLLTADICARYGMTSAILGFSFNEAPMKSLIPDFAAVHSSVRFQLRDPVSLQRFERFCGLKGILVADAAFVLKDKPVEHGLSKWILEHRQAERRVLGFNIHPMLVSNASEIEVLKIIQKTIAAIKNISDNRNVAWVLMPHDHRGQDGDMRCLGPIAEALRALYADRVYLLNGENDAATLKGVAGALDGVVSGRMHLAIASLGMGVPTLCVTYQGKFEGLYRHFDLPQWLLVDMEQFSQPHFFENRLIRFVDELDILTNQVKAHLPHVKKLSRSNFYVINQIGMGMS